VFGEEGEGDTKRRWWRGLGGDEYYEGAGKEPGNDIEIKAKVICKFMLFK